MKQTITFRAIFAMLAFPAVLAAVEPAAFTAQVKPMPPWRQNGDRAFAIRYSGRDWPTLQITAAWERNTFYRIDFEARADIGEQFMTLKVGGGRQRSYKWRCSGPWARYRMYVFSGENGIPSLSLHPEPGAPSGIEIRNFTVTPMTEAELQAELLPDGDFESGNPVASQWLAAHQTEAFPGAVVANTDYLAGEKNLRITFAKQQKGRPGLESLFLPMRPGKRYRLSFWARSTGDDATVGAVIDTFAPNHTGGHFYRQQRFVAGREWRNFTVEAAIPADTGQYPDLLDGVGRIRFHAVSGDPQEILLDDISFAELPATP